jgi:hypothetical protein
MFKKIMKILLLIVIIGSLSSVNAGNLCLDSYWGQVASYHVSDLTTNELIISKQISAGIEKNKNIDDSHLGHKLLITCDFYTGYDPDQISVYVNSYNGIWINVYAEGFLRFFDRQEKRINRLSVEYGNHWQGNVYNSTFIIPV